MLKRITVQKSHRMLVVKNGRVHSILRPGTHFLWMLPFARLETEAHSLKKLVFKSRWIDYSLCERPGLVAEHFRVVQTSDSQIAMISVNGELFQALLPGRRIVFWKNIGRIDVEVISLVDEAPKRPLRFAVQRR